VYVAHPQAAQACSCAEQSQKQAFESSSAVFEGRVHQIQPAGDGDQKRPPMNRVTLRVVRIWKGAESEQITVLTASDSAACGYAFEVNKSYLVYAQANDPQGRQTGDEPASDTPAQNKSKNTSSAKEKEVWTVGLCSRTQPMIEADKDLAKLGLGVVPVNPQPTEEEMRAFAPPTTPRTESAGCASCEVVAQDRRPSWALSAILCAFALLWLRRFKDDLC